MEGILLSSEMKWLLIKFREIFNIADNNLIRSQIVIVRIANERIGILVDKIIGPHQTVLQPFSSLVKGVNVSGATILEDGNMFNNWFDGINNYVKEKNMSILEIIDQEENADNKYLLLRLCWKLCYKCKLCRKWLMIVN